MIHSVYCHTVHGNEFVPDVYRIWFFTDETFFTSSSYWSWTWVTLPSRSPFLPAWPCSGRMRWVQRLSVDATRETHVYRVLHTPVGAADDGLTGDFRLARPHWNTMARLSWHAKYPNPLQLHGWWFVLKSIAHGSKCPMELCLPIDVGRKYSLLMKTCSEFPLHLWGAANEVIQIVHVYM